MPVGKHNPPPKITTPPKHRIAHPKPAAGSKPVPHKIKHPKPTAPKPRPHKIKHPRPRPAKPQPHKVKHPKPPPKPAASAYIKFRTKNGSIDSVSVLFGDGSVKVQSGYGGWTVTNRQRRVGLTTWEGREPFRMTVPILFDGFIHGVSQEIAISRLSRMALPPGTGNEPPVINITGAGLPNPGPVDWVIESFDWGDNVIWDFSRKGVMSRLRQDCLVHLIQYVEEDRIAFKKIGNKTPPAHTTAPKGWRASVVVKAGEKSLVQVAKRIYKPSRPGDWKLLAKANSINDPKHIHVGQRLRVPKR